MPRGRPSWSSPLHLATALSPRKLLWTSCHPQYHQMALVQDSVLSRSHSILPNPGNTLHERSW